MKNNKTIISLQQNLNTQPIVNSMTTKELAAYYRVSTWTFKRWIKPFREQIGKKEGWFYKPYQVKIIFQLFNEHPKLIATKT